MPCIRKELALSDCKSPRSLLHDFEYTEKLSHTISRPTQICIEDKQKNLNFANN